MCKRKAAQVVQAVMHEVGGHPYSRILAGFKEIASFAPLHCIQPLASGAFVLKHMQA